MIPNVREARQVQAAINAIVQDVKLFFDHSTKRWAVCQLNENAGGLILPSRDGLTTSRPTIMFRCQTREGEYRAPAEQDVSDVVALRRRADVAWQMGGDRMADLMDAQDAKREQQLADRQKARIADIAKDMKQAVKKELT